MQILAFSAGRRLALGAALAATAACGKQDAAPFVAPDPAEFAANTGSLLVLVRRDTANSRLIPKWVAAPAGVRVNLYPEGDTIPIRQINTTATGEALFVGLEPGTYTYGTSLRAGTVVTIVPGGTAQATVVAADTVLADTVKVRIPAIVTGIVAARYINQLREQTDRYAGVTVELLRETGIGTNIYTVVADTVTDAVGAYGFILDAGPERAQVRIDSRNITQLTDPMLLFLGAGVPPYVEKVETLTLPAINPDRAIVQDFLFQYNSRITISPFRDTDKDGVRDDTPTPEGMLAGDTVFFQLRDATGERTILSGTNLRAVATTNGARPVVTINGLQAGTYTIYVDRISSRFPQTPFLYTAASFPPQTVVVEASSANPQPIDNVLFPIQAP